MSPETTALAPVPSGALFTPILIGGVEVPNRIVLPAMTTRLADAEGNVTDELIAYYRARAAAGVGLVTVEMSAPERAGRHRARELSLLEDGVIPGLRRLTGALHDAGARVSIQLGHAGSRAPRRVSGETPIAPTALPTTVFEVEQQTETPLEMTAARIEQTTRAFVSVARRAQESGFDMVELHAAHGYLISQFLTPFENRRTDRWGGSLENRARFGLDVLRRIKAEVPGLPVIFRIGVEDFFEGGLRMEDGVEVAVWAAEAGSDAVSVTAGHYRSRPGAERMIPPMRYAEGAFVDFAARVKERVTAPVVGVGRLGDPARAESVVAGGSVDLIAVGRPLLADAEWPRKARAGLPVRRCVSCNHCVDTMRAGAQISCVVNPTTGRELEFERRRRPRGERICVIGAGPAGLSYASLLARDNEVTVIERALEPGGAFRYAAKAPQFNEVAAAEFPLLTYVNELELDCRRNGVRFHYGTEASPQLPALRDADRVVVATGARYRLGLGRVIPPILGTGLANLSPARRLFAVPRVRQWLYYRIRRGAGATLARELGIDARKVTVIGDAAKAGKARDAIATAFEAAFGAGSPPSQRPHDSRPATTAAPT